jgi:hypothetical protein
MSPCSGEVFSRTTQSGLRLVGTDSWGGGATAIRVKRVPVSLAPRLKVADWEQAFTLEPRTKENAEGEKNEQRDGNRVRRSGRRACIRSRR